MSRLDRLVQESDLVMTTCLCGILDPADGTLEFSNAGHPPPLIRRADGTRRAARRRAQPPARRDRRPPARARQHRARRRRRAAALHRRARGAPRRGRSTSGSTRSRPGSPTASEPPTAICDGIVAALAPALGDDVAILALARAPMAAGELHVVLPAQPTAARRAAPAARRVAGGAGRRARASVSDIVLAVHEAAMNAVEHAYGPGDAELTVRRLRAAAARSRSSSGPRPLARAARSRSVGAVRA